jgi:hypothetical protein
MLRAIHEWVQSNDYNERLEYTEVISMGRTFGMNDIQSLNVFETLVDEGYINARLTKGHYGGPRFMSAFPKSLTEKGLIAIGEVPDPTERLIRGFRAAIQSIEQDPTIPEDEKRRKIDGLNQSIGFLVSLGAAYTKQILDGIVAPPGG